MFKYKDMQMVYDVNSSSLHEVDNLGWDLIGLMQNGDDREQISTLLSRKYHYDQVEEALLEVRELREKKLLFSPVPKLDKGKLSSVGIKALCLFISHNCNLGCSYCFTRREEEKTLSHMSWEVGKKAVDFLLEYEGGYYREMDFFGGEPLLNFPLIRRIVEYAREKSYQKKKEFNFTLTTNASLLQDEIIDFLNRENINVVLSLDGRPQIHDLMRSFKNGNGSYHKTVENIKKLLHSRENKNYYIRGTFTRNNLDFYEDIEHILGLGFDSLSLEPVVTNEGSLSLREEDLHVVERQYDRLVDLYLERKEKGNPFLFYHFILDMEKGPCLYKRLSGCGAGMDYLAVAADGSLYPCHQFVGMDEFYMGNITDQQVSVKREIGERIDGAAWQREECPACWARYLCGRGCAASSYFQGGDLCSTYKLGCDLQKMRLERALYLQAV
ncbi:MAG: thioether cross-link-forming SCIFF peptide maturase [Bacillota bacterium]|nr:thioether cross-link-forming SCIFF peptide maturase [Bacillota bacterium]